MRGDFAQDVASDSGEPTHDLVLVKLGGSLLTDKQGEAAVRREVLDRLAAEIARALGGMEEALILGHGSGSYGHVLAARHGLGKAPTEGKAFSARAVSSTQQAAARLHHLVLEALRDAGVDAFSMAPSSAMITRGGRPVSWELEPLDAALATGLVPVLYGDVVMDRLWGAAICSTERLMLDAVRWLLRKGHRVRRALWLGETEGIYDGNGKTIPRIDTESAREVRGHLAGASGTDVTGGMGHRLDNALALARLGVRSWIIDGRCPGHLEQGLLGGSLGGTLVEA